MKNKLFLLVSSIFLIVIMCVPTNVHAEIFNIASDMEKVNWEMANNQYPYSSVVRLSGKSACSGVVVGKDYVLTASHCHRSEKVTTVIDGTWIRFGINKSESYYSPHSGSYNDFALLKVYTGVYNGNRIHLGDVRKPLTVLGYNSKWAIDNDKQAALIGYPNGQSLRQKKVWITSYSDKGNIQGWFSGGKGGMSGGAVVNRMGQLLGPYHGSGNGKAKASLVKIKDLLNNTNIRNETSRIYIWKDFDTLSEKIKLIKPEGVYIEKNNNAWIDMDTLFNSAAQVVKPGYIVNTLSDGIRTFKKTDTMYMPIGGLELYPKDITPIKYSISFDKNAEDATGDTGIQQFTYDEEEKPLSTNKYSRDGYTFAGWSDKADGTGTTYTDKASVSNLTATEGATVTLYAQWVQNIQKASISYIDDTTGITLETDNLTGAYGTIDSYRTADKIAEYNKLGYEFDSTNYPVDGVNYDQLDVLQKFEVRLHHSKTTEEEAKNVTQTIHYIYDDGHLAAEDYTAKIEFKRLNSVDNVTKVVEHGEWVPQAETNFKSVKSPVIPGYNADKDEISEITGIIDTSGDIEEIVTYTKSSTSMQQLSLYRLYNPNSGEHFYTLSEGERNLIEAAGWTNEGTAWITPSRGDDVYRLYNPNGGEHLYTMNNLEYDNLATRGWIKEGVAFRSSNEKLVPVYRSYNPNSFANNHLYTESLLENSELVSLGWKDEEIAFYSLK